jgi:ABC-type hemin transport system substrate-binding protein
LRGRHVLIALAALAACRTIPKEARVASVVDDAGVGVHVPAAPERIVSLIPASTELVFALGEGDRLVGRTTWCDWPPDAQTIPNLGNGIDPSVEAVVGTRPDLVLLYRSGSNRAAAERLRGFRIPVLELEFNTLDDFRRITRLLGNVLGVQSRADSLIARTDSALARVAPPVDTGGMHASRSPLDVARDTASSSDGTSTSPSPAAITSAKSARGSGFTNVIAPPITTSGWRWSRSAARNGRPASRSMASTLV